MNMKEKVEKIIIDSVKKIGEKNKISSLINPNIETELYGIGGNLDSLSLVYLAVNLEETLFEEFEIGIELVDDKAMSQKNSPFKSILSLKEYVLDLLSE